MDDASVELIAGAQESESSQLQDRATNLRLAEGITDEEIRRILDSQTFERSPALRALLAYLWQHRVESISEYAIATEALGRNHSFDPRIDATVRVQVSRLRQRLERYYAKENASAHRRLTIPLGSHQVVWEELGPPVAILTSSVEVPVRFPELELPLSVPPKGRAAIGRLFLVILCVAFLMEGGYLLYLQRQLQAAQRSTPIPRVPRFWQHFFNNRRPTRIVLPTPVFFSFGRELGGSTGAIMLRDTEVNQFSSGINSAVFRQLSRALGMPALAESYTVTSDTFAAVRLARYLDGLQLQTAVTSSADDPMEALDRENLIAIGTWGTLEPLSPYLKTMSFELGPHESSVTLRHPSQGEPKRIDSVVESSERAIWPGVIGFLPSRNGGNHLLVLASRHTSALVSFLTSSNGLTQLDDLWRAKGSPEYFEVLVSAELSGRTVVRTSIASLREFKSPQ